jgi:hypothetical protein
VKICEILSSFYLIDAGLCTLFSQRRRPEPVQGAVFGNETVMGFTRPALGNSLTF